MIAVAVRMWMLWSPGCPVAPGAGTPPAGTIDAQDGFGLLVLAVVAVVLLLLLHVQLLVGIVEGGEGEFHPAVPVAYVLGVQTSSGVVGGWWRRLLLGILAQRGSSAGVQVKVVLLGSRGSWICGGVSGASSSSPSSHGTTFFLGGVSPAAVAKGVEESQEDEEGKRGDDDGHQG